MMPIVFKAFLKKYYPNVPNEYEVECAAIIDSDLSQYKCLPTKNIRQFFKKLEDGSVVIVVGGETLNSKALQLYSFYIDNRILQWIVTRLLKTGSFISGAIGSRLCRTGFEFPFTPPPEAFHADVKICYNSVGGGIPKSGLGRQILLNRLKSACYISVRDTRIVADLKEIGQSVHVVPDSVSAVAELFCESDFLEHVSERIRLMKGLEYFIFQASPNKSNSCPEEISKALREAEASTGVPFFLLPIGYAAGHDDRKYLSEISSVSGIPMLDELNIWEITWVLKNSKAYFGTSLHGAVVSMAYSKPHFAIGNVPKLQKYLDQWSKHPFTGRHKITEIPHLASLLTVDYSDILSDIASNTKYGALKNMADILTKSCITK
jgi:polysaccharide pyruvyl transferase WcaK-like protein